MVAQDPTNPAAGEPDQPEEPIVRDKRRIDPETGEVREPVEDAAEESTGLSPEDQALLDEASGSLLAELRDDLARAQAELYNFRARVERDRAANREAIIVEVIREVLPVLDDLDRAEAHGDLEEGSPLALVAQKMRSAFDRYLLERVGEVGEVFDPNRHEAVARVPVEGAEGETVADVLEPGYAVGERLVRPAKVAVAVPAE